MLYELFPASLSSHGMQRISPFYFFSGLIANHKNPAVHTAPAVSDILLFQYIPGIPHLLSKRFVFNVHFSIEGTKVQELIGKQKYTAEKLPQTEQTPDRIVPTGTIKQT